MTDPRLIRLIMALTEDGMYRVDLMDVRNGSQVNLTDHLYYTDARDYILKALERWNNAKS